MQLRYPDEVEVRREGFDEGQGHGFDNMDTSALASRTLASKNPAASVVEWFVKALISLGWEHRGEGELRRDAGEWILLRIERDSGVSRVAALINDERGRALQDRFEQEYYSQAPEGSTLVTVFYGVAAA